MFDRNSDYALNKKDPDAIVCKSATGIHIRLTRADFSSAEEFEKWKLSRSFAQWQQSAKTMIYHNIEKTDLYKQVCLWQMTLIVIQMNPLLR